MKAEAEKWDRRRIARYVLLASLAVMFLTTSFRTHDVALRYDVSGGELKIALFDDEGDRLRTTWFPGPPYEHTVSLAEGRYTVRLSRSDDRECVRSFSVVDEHPVIVDGCQNSL